MKRAGTSGPLVIIGGAEDKRGPCTILREFVRLAGGPRAHLVVMTVATAHPEEVGAEYAEVFRRLGAKQVRAVGVAGRDGADEAEALTAVDWASGVFFTSGDQLRITTLLGGTKIDQALHRRHQEGVVLGGTSAGASMMSNTMIIEGRRWSPRA